MSSNSIRQTVFFRKDITYLGPYALLKSTARIGVCGHCQSIVVQTTPKPEAKFARNVATGDAVTYSENHLDRGWRGSCLYTQLVVVKSCRKRSCASIVAGKGRPQCVASGSANCTSQSHTSVATHLSLHLQTARRAPADLQRLVTSHHPFDLACLCKFAVRRQPGDKNTPAPWSLHLSRNGQVYRRALRAPGKGTRQSD